MIIKYRFGKQVDFLFASKHYLENLVLTATYLNKNFETIIIYVPIWLQ